MIRRGGMRGREIPLAALWGGDGVLYDRVQAGVV